MSPSAVVEPGASSRRGVSPILPWRALPRFGGRTVDDLPNVRAYVERIAKRPAYAKAMAIAGPAATRPGA